MPDFHVYSYDVSWNRLGEVPLNGLRFGSLLNGAGTLSGTVPPERGTSLSSSDLLGLTAPGERFLVVDMDGQVVWGGILWSRNRKQAPLEWDIGATEFLSYFDSRIMAADYMLDIDPFTLIEDLVNNAQAVKNGSVGIIVPTGTAGTTILPLYLKMNRMPVSTAISDISGADALAECWIDVAYENWVPVPTLQLGYPRIGRTAAASGIVVDLKTCPAPGYQWPEDASVSGTTIWELGYGRGLAQLNGSASAPLSTGQLLLEKVITRQGVMSEALLSQHAAADLKLYPVPVPTPTVPLITAGPGSQTSLTSMKIGDDCRVVVASDENFPAGLDQTWRIVQMDTSVPDEGNAITTLTLNIPRSFTP